MDFSPCICTLPHVQCIKCFNLFNIFMSFWLYILFSQRCQKNVGEVEVVTDLDDYFNSRIDEGEGSLKNDDDRLK